MQIANGDPRGDLTVTQVSALLEADTIQVVAGLELFDADETFLQDISDDLESGEVSRGNYRTIHGTCRLRIARELQWGSQRVKPYLSLSDGTVTARFNLGVFLLATPERHAGETPAVWDVDGFDKLEVLAHPHGATYAADAGDAYLTLVAGLITGAGESKILIDPTAAATTLPTARTWPLLEESSTLGIVNDLLAAVGYRALWVGPDGYYRSEPYVSPASRGSEWTYSADSASTTVAVDRMSSADFFGVPNRWVFVNNDPAVTEFPTEGDGIYTVLNQSDGVTSIDQRGRTITSVVTLAAANQAALVTQGDRTVEGDKTIVRRLTIPVSANPLHSHFDVVTVVDAELGLSGSKYVVTDWRLPLTGQDMVLELKAV